MKVKIVIDAEDIELVYKGRHQGYERFTASREIGGLVATVFVRPDWDPKKVGIKGEGGTNAYVHLCLRQATVQTTPNTLGSSPSFENPG